MSINKIQPQNSVSFCNALSEQLITKTITASNLLQNPQQNCLTSNAPWESDYSTYFTILTCRIFCKKFASLIWQKYFQAIRFAHLPKKFASNSFCSFGKRSHFTGPIFLFALYICKIILNIGSFHYLQIGFTRLAYK